MLPVRTIWSAVFSFSICLMGSVLLGLLVYGTPVFDTHLIYFQFVAAGVFCGALVVAVDALGPRSVAPVGLVGYGVMFWQNGANTLPLFLRAGVWIVGLTTAVLGARWASRRLSSHQWPQLAIEKFVIWSVGFGFVHLCMFGFLSVVNRRPIDPMVAVMTMRLGGLIGAGVGLGYEVARWYMMRKWETEKSR